jgi:uncharacterized protein (TIGR03067 family)
MARGPQTRSVLHHPEAHVRLEDFWDEPAAGVAESRSDLERLQGAWLAVAGRRQAEFLIAGNRIAVHFADGDVYLGSFTLDTDGRHALMDVRVEEGPSRHKELIAQCIYEVAGDVLRFCAGSPGQGDRPTAFAEVHPLHLCLIFRREHARSGGD